MAKMEMVTYLKDEEVLMGFADVLGERSAKSYISSVLIAVRNSDVLMRCDPKSVYVSALRAATMQLSVDPSVGQAYLVPFKGQCTLIVGYKGFYDMAIRTGKYRYIQVTKVREGQDVTEDPMTGFHSFEGFKTSDIVVGWFGSFQLVDGYTKTLYLTLEEIHDHAKQYSKSYNNPKGLWQQNPSVMERKTIFRILLTKWGYIAPADRHALLSVEKEDGIIIELPEIVETEPPEISMADEVILSDETVVDTETGELKTRQEIIDRTLSENEAHKETAKKEGTGWQK